MMDYTVVIGHRIVTHEQRIYVVAQEVQRNDATNMGQWVVLDYLVVPNA